MQWRFKQLLESYERVIAFLRANVPEGASAAYVAKREELVVLVAQLRSLLVDQLSALNEARDDITRTEIARETLLERHLRPIALVARGAIDMDPATLKVLAMPESRLSTSRLVNAALSFRNAAQKYEALLVANGRPADFLVRLDEAIDALNERGLARAANIGLRVGAKAGVKQQLRRCRKMLSVIESLVLEAYAHDDDMRARWRVARRVQAMGGGGTRATGGTADENLPPEDEPKAA